MINVCHAFSLLSASNAVGIKAKHKVITSKASQQTCSSSMSGSLPAFVCKVNQMNSMNGYGKVQQICLASSCTLKTQGDTKSLCINAQLNLQCKLSHTLIQSSLPYSLFTHLLPCVLNYRFSGVGTVLVYTCTVSSKVKC